MREEKREKGIGGKGFVMDGVFQRAG